MKYALETHGNDCRGGKIAEEQGEEKMIAYIPICKSRFLRDLFGTCQEKEEEEAGEGGRNVNKR